MKKRKILYLFPLAALILSGCTFQEAWETSKSWVGNNVYLPVKGWVEKLLGKESKKEEKKDEEQQPGGDQPGGDQPGGGGEQSDVETIGSLEAPISLSEFVAAVDQHIDYSTVNTNKTVTDKERQYFVKAKVTSNTAMQSSNEMNYVNLAEDEVAVTGYWILVNESFREMYKDANALKDFEVVIRGFGGLYNKNGTKTYEILKADDDHKAELVKVIQPETVVPVSSVAIEPTEGTVEVGSQINFTATVSPEDATYKTVKWSINEAGEEFATLDNGVVRGIKAGGDAIITATSVADPTKSASATVHVIAEDVEEGVVKDVLTRESTQVEGTTYTDWEGVEGENSAAVYAGQSAGGNDAIQLRSDKSSAGIISTTSGGKIRKVAVLWNSNTASGRKINIYGSHSAYGLASDLYNEQKAGTLLGSIEIGKSTDLKITEDYEYVGVRSNYGALWLDSIAFSWKQNVAVEKVELDKENIQLHIGGGEQVEKLTESLTATVTPNNATEKTVTWSVEPEGVVTVENGTVTAVKAGSATITATAGGKSDTCAVSVIQHVTGVSITESVSVLEGETTQVQVIVSPADATNKAYTLSSLDEETATVDQDGTVHGVKEGSTKIKVVTADGAFEDTCDVEVTKLAVPVTGVETEMTSLNQEITHGSTLQLEAHAVPSNATENTLLTWTVEDDDPAGCITVSQSGEVTAVEPGTAKVRATSKAHNDLSLVFNITVNKIPVTLVEIKSVVEAPAEPEVVSSLTLVKEDIVNLQAVISPSNATYKAVTWASSDDDVATVVNGKVTAIDSGTATITATADGVSATCSVKVTGPKGSEDNPYTTAEAKAAATSTAVDNTYVKGIIYKVQDFISNDGQITYWISDNGTGNSYSKDGIEIYKGLNESGAKFSAKSDLQPGDEVIVKGKLKLYSGTSELDTGAVIISHRRPDMTSFDLVGTPRSEYHEGDKFNTTGLVAQATLDNGVAADVSEFATWTYTVDNAAATTATLGDTSVRITATYREQSSYVDASITVLAGATNYGTAENPISVADAIAIIKNEPIATEQNMYITGVVKSNEAWSTKYSNMGLYLEVPEGELPFQLYKTTFTDSSTQTTYAAENSMVGRTIIVGGAKGLLFNNSKYELDGAKISFVSAAPATDLEFKESSYSVKQGATLDLAAEINLSPAGAFGTVTYDVTGNEDVTVNATTGLLSVAAGASTENKATVTASLSGTNKTATCEITVLNASAATEQEVYKLDGTVNTSGSSYASATDLTQGGIGWLVVANTQMDDGWRFGGKNITDTDRTCTSKGAVSSDNISKVIVTTGNATATVNSVSLLVGTTQGASDISSITLTSNLANKGLEFERPDGKDWSSKYFTIVFNVTCGGSNQYIQLKSVSFYAVK